MARVLAANRGARASRAVALLALSRLARPASAQGPILFTPDVATEFGTPVPTLVEDD